MAQIYRVIRIKFNQFKKMRQRQTFLGVFTYKTAAKINYGIIDMEQYYLTVTLCIDNQPELGLLS